MYGVSVEEFRLQYPLDSESLVLDVGAYRGDFTRWCIEKWGCLVFAFEPLPCFYNKLQKVSGLVRFNYGLGGSTRIVMMEARGDSSSIYHEPGAASQPIQIRDVAEVFSRLSRGVDLMKINIEGGEYELLERMLEKDLVRLVRFFQIQWHGCGAGPQGADEHRLMIRDRLESTHREQWCENGGQWESWERR